MLCIMLSVMLFFSLQRPKPQPNGAAPEPPPTPAGTKAAVPPAVVDPALFPPEMVAELQINDPAWADLRPEEQVTYINQKLATLGKDPHLVPPLQLTLGYAYERQGPASAKAAADAYYGLWRFANGAEPYRFAGQALLHAADLYLAAGAANPQLGGAKLARRALDGIVMAEQRAKEGQSLPLWSYNQGQWQAAPDPYLLALTRIDQITRSFFMYRVIDFLVHLTGNRPGWSHVAALLLLALALNIATYPLSRMSYRSMREMQRIQPLVQEVQKKYKDNPQRQQQELMAVYKEHGVNPLAGCLPMLIQMPVFIFVYGGIRAYTLHFYGASVLWIHSLAKPDWPLLIMYAISMFISQKIMMAGQATSGDPQQQQMQKTMSWMMPIMFTYMMSVAKLPSAFYFYWMAFNVLTTTSQWLNRRAAMAREAAAPALVVAPPPAESGPPAPLRPAGRAKGKGKKGK
jgi:YidC/Oxa1 family membrane protein insertase